MKVIWQNVSTEGREDLPNKHWTQLHGLTREKSSRAKGIENCEGTQALGMATNFVSKVSAYFYSALQKFSWPFIILVEQCDGVSQRLENVSFSAYKFISKGTKQSP